MIETILFVCEDNSILSPMAEAFLRRHGNARFQVFSAGIEPRPIHLYTLQVMEEIGYDLYNPRVKSIFDLNYLQRVDYLVTLTDFVNDHFVFNKENIGNHLHWPFKNPLFQPGQVTGHVDPPLDRSLQVNPFSIPSQWYSPSTGQLKTSLTARVEIQITAQEGPHIDIQTVRARFCRVRDEIEVQVMNWLEENGVSPLWWRGCSP